MGQKQDYVRSELPFYLKWTGPTQFRQGDEPSVELVAFNSQAEATSAEVTISGGSEPHSQTTTLAPGANYLLFPLQGMQSSTLSSQLSIQKQPVDTLQTTLGVRPLAWPAPQQQQLGWQPKLPLTLPEDAVDLRLSLQSAGDGALRRVLDDLITYPYGCLEQTASRLIPLAIAYRLTDEAALRDAQRAAHPPDPDGKHGR